MECVLEEKEGLHARKLCHAMISRAVVNPSTQTWAHIVVARLRTPLVLDGRHMDATKQTEMTQCRECLCGLSMAIP